MCKFINFCFSYLRLNANLYCTTEVSSTDLVPPKDVSLMIMCNNCIDTLYKHLIYNRRVYISDQRRN